MIAANIQTALRLVYPSRCVTCGDLVEGDFGLCGTCWRDTPFASGLVCDCCGIPLQGEAMDDEIVHCDECMTSDRPWQQGRTALLYSKNARRLILALKHGDRQDIARPAAQWMAHVAKPLLSSRILVAPVPLHWTRLVKRRYNQAAVLAETIARQLGLSYCPDLLQRPRESGNMEGLSKTERFAKVKNAIAPHPKRKHRMAGRPVLLVDDVMTSGATLAACADACLQSRASFVNVLTLARVAKDT
jgi:ComF family protein